MICFKHNCPQMPRPDLWAGLYSPCPSFGPVPKKILIYIGTQPNWILIQMMPPKCIVVSTLIAFGHALARDFVKKPAILDYVGRYISGQHVLDGPVRHISGPSQKIEEPIKLNLRRSFLIFIQAGKGSILPSIISASKECGINNARKLELYVLFACVLFEDSGGDH